MPYQSVPDRRPATSALSRLLGGAARAGTLAPKPLESVYAVLGRRSSRSEGRSAHQCSVSAAPPRETPADRARPPLISSTFAQGHASRAPRRKEGAMALPSHSISTHHPGASGDRQTDASLALFPPEPAPCPSIFPTCPQPPSAPAPARHDVPCANLPPRRAGALGTLPPRPAALSFGSARKRAALVPRGLPSEHVADWPLEAAAWPRDKSPSCRPRCASGFTASLRRGPLAMRDRWPGLGETRPHQSGRACDW